MYSYAQPKYEPLGNFFPWPIDPENPVFIVKSKLSKESLNNFIATLQPSLIAAPLAATSVNNKDGTVTTGTNAYTRNTRSLDTALISQDIREELERGAKIAWKQYSFCAEEPVGNQYQLLAYTEADKGFFVPHFDDSYGHGGVLWRNRPDRTLTGLIYLNDDFEGGEIQFNYILDEEGKPFKYKPKAGEIIYFPPHEAYMHEVLPVTKGTRYCASRWWDDTEWFQDFGVLDTNAQNTLTEFFKAPMWRFGHMSLQRQTGLGNSYFDRMFVDGDIRKMNEDKSKELENISPVISNLWKQLKESPICWGHSLIRAYANAHTYGIEGYPHKDAEDRNNFTTMIYCNPTWKKEWGGETVFWGRNGNTRRAVTPSPFKIIQFRGDMLHAARPLTRDCKELRITLMFKTKRIVEIQPELRTGLEDPFVLRK
jgi:predicted 2-oxoglutarate/Fe(II)-dependent dioxygenase YbiX